jgi:hypothetical protein
LNCSIYRKYFKKYGYFYNIKLYFRDDVGSAAHIINFEAMEQSAVCIVSDSPDVKEEKEEK